jgi:hypothetical protein
VASGKAGAKKEARKLKARKAPDGFKPDAAAGDGPERNDIRLRGVGFAQYRKSAGIPQAASALDGLAALNLQNGLTITKITIPIIRTVGTSLIIR